MNSPLYLGVDGGGTKTAFALIDSSGAVLGREVLGGSYFVGEPDRIPSLHGVLTDGVQRLLGSLDRMDVAAAFLGLPGFGEAPGDVPLIEAAVADVLPGVQVRCDNDMVTAWAGAFAGGDGIVVIGGTGAMSYGRRGDKAVRVGGWGELFGDEGSGYWIAIQGLNAWTRMSDARQPPGPLLALVRDRLDLAQDADLIDLVLNRWQGRRADIAALAPLIVAAADDGDDACLGILHQAGVELALLATAARHALGESDPGLVPVSYIGGVFTSPTVFRSFSAEVERAGGFDRRPPQLAPDLGAAVQAADLAGRPLSQAAIEHLQDLGSEPSGVVA